MRMRIFMGMLAKRRLVFAVGVVAGLVEQAGLREGQAALWEGQAALWEKCAGAPPSWAPL